MVLILLRFVWHLFFMERPHECIFILFSFIFYDFFMFNIFWQGIWPTSKINFIFVELLIIFFFNYFDMWYRRTINVSLVTTVNSLFILLNLVLTFKIKCENFIFTCRFFYFFLKYTVKMKVVLHNIQSLSRNVLLGLVVTNARGIQSHLSFLLVVFLDSLRNQTLKKQSLVHLICRCVYLYKGNQAKFWILNHLH